VIRRCDSTRLTLSSCGCGAFAQVHQLYICVQLATLGCKAASNFLLATSTTRMYSCAILALLPVGKFVSSTCSHPFWMAAPSDQTIPRRRNCKRPLAVAPTMPNFDPGVGPCCDPSPRLSTGVGISGDEINYRGADLPLPKPFQLSM